MRLPYRPNIAQLQRGVRYIGLPEPGFFRLRQVRRGPWVPALIWRPCPMIEPVPGEATPDPEEWCCPTERPRPLRATIGDREVDPHEVWTRGTVIQPREYHHMMGVRAWAKTYAPTQPEARPHRPVDLTREPSLF